MRRYEGRRAVVTGAGSGIGQAVVARLLEEGARVVAIDVDEAGLEVTVKAAGDDAADRVAALRVDIASEQSVADGFDAALEFLGGCELLVNAAGIMRTSRSHEITLDHWNTVIGVNLTGTMLMVRAWLPQLLESKRGVIVNFSSTSAFFGHPYMAAYSASKGAITAFTHALAVEYAKDGLRAVNIVPGGISTGITSGLQLPDGADARLFMKMIPMIGGGLGNPADVAAVVALAGSDDGRFITGSEIRVDGGAHM